MKVNFDQLDKRYDEITAAVRCQCVAATIIAGGQPGTEDGVRAFVAHHLKLEGPVAEEAIKRIVREELGERPVPAETGELDERLTYGVNVIRRSAIGPWLGAWMIHACLKQSASRLGIFVDYKNQGAKGNWSEAAKVRPVGASLLDPKQLTHVYLVGPDGTPAQTEWHEFKGRVGSAQGSKSIVHHTECVPPGTRFDFEFRFIRRDVKSDDIQDVLALMMTVGLGSVKSLGCGKFRIEEAEIMDETRSLKRDKPNKPQKVKAEPRTAAGQKAVESVEEEQSIEEALA